VRAFVIIVVMLMMAIATAIAVNQFTLVASEVVTSTRVDEEVQARAAAENCLTLLHTYASRYIGTSPPGFNFVDFDGLLDRNGTPDDDDDFLPSFGTAVLVPRNLTPTTGATAAAHRWAFLARGTAPNQAGCLLRLEDNSDDAFPASSVPGGTTGTGEGTGRDVPNRDRDRSVYLSVIGLYPVLPGTPDAEAWERAHSRVTLRRLFATTNPVETPPAVQACRNVSLSGNTSIEGLGGVQGNAITVSGSSTCGCGAYVGATVPASPPSQCSPTNCSPVSVKQSTPTCTTPTLPNTTYYMDNKGFGDPGTTTNNIGNRSSCKIYIDRVGRVFAWDTTDSFANEPTGPLAAEVAAGRIPSSPRHNCTDYTGIDDGTGTGNRIVELPCSWDTRTDDGDGESVTCDFTNANRKRRQTPCWKPIANLGDHISEENGGNDFSMNSDVTYGTPVELGETGRYLTSNWFEYSYDENDEDLAFLKNKPIPNIRDQTMMFATGDLTTTMCGDPNGCEDCDGTDHNDWWTECSRRAPSLGTQVPSCRDFHSHEHQSNRHIPWPIVFAWDVDPAFAIEFEFEPSPSEPLNATILSNGKIAFAGDVSFCCAECGQDGADLDIAPDAPGTGHNCQRTKSNPGLTGVFIAPADCVEGNAEVPNPSFVPPPPVPGSVQFLPSGYGYAFKTDGDCVISGDSTVVGDVECRSIEVPGNPCVVGNLMATGGSSIVGCTNAPCPATSDVLGVGVCLQGAPKLIGDIYAQGSVCNAGGGSLKGDVFSMGNIVFTSTFTLEGQIFAAQNISLSSDTTINFTGSDQILSAGNQGLTSFMETCW
jgi:hypothetical protein